MAGRAVTGRRRRAGPRRRGRQVERRPAGVQGGTGKALGGRGRTRTSWATVVRARVGCAGVEEHAVVSSEKSGGGTRWNGLTRWRRDAAKRGRRLRKTTARRRRPSRAVAGSWASAGRTVEQSVDRTAEAFRHRVARALGLAASRGNPVKIDRPYDSSQNLILFARV